MSQINVDEKKKRGRKKQNTGTQLEPVVINQSTDKDILTTTSTEENGIEKTNEVIDENKPLPKKRGRKPKGGKIIQQTVIHDNSKDTEPNIILHLKCSLKDICDTFQETFKYDPNVESIQSFNFDNNKSVIFFADEFDVENPPFVVIRAVLNRRVGGGGVGHFDEQQSTSARRYHLVQTHARGVQSHNPHFWGGV